MIGKAPLTTQRVRVVRLFGYTLRLAVLLPLYALAAFGGLGFQALGRWLLNRSDDLYDVAGVRDARRLLNEVEGRG